MMDQCIAIHGGGYVGLTAALHYALSGFDVTIYDPDIKTVNGINQGVPRDGEFLSYLNVDFYDLIQKNHLKATNQFHDILKHKIHSLAVPTEKNGEPYDSIVNEVIPLLAQNAQPDSVVLIESTLTPGTLKALLPTIQNKLPEPIRLGVNWHIAVCPRRDWFADPNKNLATLDRVVGGATPTCTQKAIQILSKVSQKIHTTDFCTAEICKALENALLHVPLMFAHELALALPEHNIAEALRLAGTHWRLMQLHLSFGTGGRCVPLGTKYLVKATNNKLKIGQQALENDKQLRFLIAEHLHKKLPQEARILVMGIGYRPGFRDMGLSPGLQIARHLSEMGNNVAIWDTLWTQDELALITGLKVRPPSPKESAILLATPHPDFIKLPQQKELWCAGQQILDAQGAWRSYKNHFSGLGVSYVQVGEPGWIS